MREKWKPVVGWEDCYEVSNLGRVRSIDRVVYFSDGRVRRYQSQVLAQYLGDGYPKATLHRNCDYRRAHVHVLVAAAFMGPCPEGQEVCHEDGNRLNPAAKNLRYDTRKGNASDMERHGTLLRGDARWNCKFSDGTVAAIRAARGTEKQTETAARFGISRSHCCAIQKGNRR